MSESKSYYPDLYIISKELHKLRENGDTLNEVQTIHNGLVNFYSQLLGEKHYKKRKDSLTYMPVIDFATASNENLEKLCTFYLNYMRNEKPGEPPGQKTDPDVRKAKYMLTKIDLSTSTKLADQAMLLAEKYHNINIDHTNNNVDKYNNHYTDYQQKVRNYIKICSKLYLVILTNRKDKNTFKKYFVFTRLAFEKIWECTELQELEKEFDIWKPHYRAFLYMDTSLWIILQAVTNCIIWNSDVSCPIEYLNQLSEKVEYLTKNKTIKSVPCSENIFMTYSEFLLYPSFCSKFMENILALKQLQDSCTDNKPPEKEYSLITDSGAIKKLTTVAQRCSIFLEGDTKGKRAFRENLKKCHEFIDLYNEVTKRNLGHDEITLKAIYRQLVLEKTRRNKRQSITTFNDFIRNRKFRSKEEYYFINEKINFGMYRERGKVKEFFAKNELQEKLYELSTLLLTRLDPTEIIQEAQKDYSELFSLLETLIPGTDDLISYEEIETSFLIITSQLEEIVDNPFAWNEVFSEIQTLKIQDSMSYEDDNYEDDNYEDDDYEDDDYEDDDYEDDDYEDDDYEDDDYEDDDYEDGDYEENIWLLESQMYIEDDSHKQKGCITCEEVDACFWYVCPNSVILNDIINNPLVHAIFIQAFE